MGVTKLWQIVEEAGKPVRLESLRRKRLAIDASIWVYQFLKAVRNKEGVALSASHIVGFLRRICKLLYHGAMPVFVFDGGAPILKMNTLAKRREKREGNRHNAKGTAQKLLLMKMKKLSERPKNIESSENSEPTEKRFRKLDEYHLPELDKFEYSTKDGRVLSPEVYKKYMESLDDDIDEIDLNKVDPGSAAFQNLSLEKQYMILQKLRLKSRLRMGYSKEQLQKIFPNSLEFSKFQVDMVAKRNMLTQKLLKVVGLNDNLPDIDSIRSETKRFAADHEQSYTLQRNETGWSLSFKEGTNEENAISVDEPESKKRKLILSEILEEKEYKRPLQSVLVDGKPLTTENPDDSEDDEDDVEWEDVIESKKTVSPEVNVEEKVLDHVLNQSKADYDAQYEREMKQAIEMSKKELSELYKEQQALLDEEPGELIPESVEIKQDSIVDKAGAAPKVVLGKSIFNKMPEWFEKTDMSAKEAYKDRFLSNKADDNSGRTEIGKDGSMLIEGYTEVINDISQSSDEDDQIMELKEAPEIIESDDDDDDDDSKEDVKIVKSTKISSKTEASQYPGKPIRIDLDEFEREQAEQKEEATKVDSEDFDLNAVEKIDVENATNSNEVVKQTSKGEASIPEEVKETEGQELNKNVEPDGAKSAPSNKIRFYEFEDQEEEELEKELEQEELAHEQFEKNLAKEYKPQRYNYNEAALKAQHKRELRDSDEVTDVMIEEVKDLLTCFGVPYITAPMEAEAQCAKLLEFGLVDGIVTDDSDCFLFGGDKVYRHIFTEKKFGEFYELKSLETKLGLTREKLISLAYLLGSDYTEGLKGIGPVMAMKILQEFGTLEKFRDWCIFCQEHKQPETDNKFRKSLRKRLMANEVFIDKSFPDSMVKMGYSDPSVDNDTTEFVWGKPDLDMLRDYLGGKVGWSKEKIDGILIPIIRKMNQKTFF